ncbi:hypothetical protein GGR52DRAFT_286012 [Hypoxylon sp. FL1284]|nr:hypothetical protein GGR52DRAFT_286012 [Hypoxylon sp. FL1284]
MPIASMKATFASLLSASLPALVFAQAECHRNPMDGISVSCSDFNFTQGHTLGATCTTYPPEIEVSTILDLDRCLENRVGRIAFRPFGNFSQSCSNCTLKGITNTQLWCDCSTYNFSNGTWYSNNTLWQLSDFQYIQNCNGSLVCNGPDGFNP